MFGIKIQYMCIVLVTKKVLLLNILTVGMKDGKFDLHPFFNERIYHLVTSRIFLTKNAKGIIKAERIKAPLSILYDGINSFLITNEGLKLMA